MISVLIIDDEEMISKMLKGYLEDQGFEVATAGTGAEGLKCWCATRAGW